MFLFALFLCVFVGRLLIATVGLLGTSLGITAIVAENQILLVLAFLIVIIPAHPAIAPHTIKLPTRGYPGGQFYLEER